MILVTWLTIKYYESLTASIAVEKIGSFVEPFNGRSMYLNEFAIQVDLPSLSVNLFRARVDDIRTHLPLERNYITIALVYLL